MRSLCIWLALYFACNMACVCVGRPCGRAAQRAILAAHCIRHWAFAGRASVGAAHDVPGIYDRLYDALEIGHGWAMGKVDRAFHSGDCRGGIYYFGEPRFHSVLRMDFSWSGRSLLFISSICKAARLAHDGVAFGGGVRFYVRRHFVEVS